jgi:hypothetical protein
MGVYGEPKSNRKKKISLLLYFSPPSQNGYTTSQYSGDEIKKFT